MAAPLRVVDTSAWIEWLTGSPLGQALSGHVPEQPLCVVPTIVQLTGKVVGARGGRG